MAGLTTIIGVLALLAIAGIIVANMRKKGMDLFSTLLLIIVFWLLVMVAMPEITLQLTKSLGFRDTAAAFLSLISITALFFTIRTYFRQKDLETEITCLSREMALRKSGGKKE